MWFGETAAIERLVAEDGRRLNAQIQELLVLRGRLVEGCRPLMLTAWRRDHTTVSCLLALGADVEQAGVSGLSAVR